MKPGTLAERSAYAVMQRLGFRTPMEHSEWDAIVDAVQDCVDSEADAMRRVAESDARWNWARALKARYLIHKIKRMQSAER